MNLIIKPTEACNFKCTFCSSNNIATEKEILKLDTIKDFLDKNIVSSIIINGGDPLMLEPSYYYEILNYIEEKGYHTSLSFTSNLWDFYNNPDKWTPLFNHPKVGVITSFQYGNARRKPDNTPFEEKDFIKVFNLFKEKTGKTLSWISVITEENEDSVIKTVELTKRLNTECKINRAVQSGRSTMGYPLYKIYQKYLEIYQKGLFQYEFNTKEIIKISQNKGTICPYNRDCYRGIRAMNPNGIMHSCGCINDDYLNLIANNEPGYELQSYEEDAYARDNHVIKLECYACEYFNFCNSCYKNINEIKINNIVDIHCKEMKRTLKEWSF